MAKGKREQTVESESHVNTRQDRNTFLTDGGTWTWDASAGTLTWDSIIRIRRGGIAVSTVAAGSATSINAAGDIAYVDVDRTSGGVLTMQTGVAISSSTNELDGRVIVGVRGTDSKFYMRDGTIFSDGDSKTLGTLNAVTDRADIASAGVTAETVPFSYVLGTGQLAVYVGGMLMEEGNHYTEVDPTTINWTALGQPLAGERVSFLNIVGGQGPAGGSGNLQNAYDNGSEIDTTGGSVLRVVETTGAGALGVDDASAGLTNFLVNGNGNVLVNPGNAGFSFRDNVGTDYWSSLPLDDGSGDSIYYNSGTGKGFRVDKATGGIEFGTYTGSYPGGTWAPDSAGELKWAVYTGTIDSAGADEVIATGLSSIVGLALGVDDGNRGGTSALDMANGAAVNKRIAAFFNSGTGTVVLSGNLTQSLAIGSHLWTEAYTLIVFYQG